MTDVIVVGGGPAGRALAGACSRFGLDTALVDPNPDRPWATYATWADELPTGTPVAATVTTVRANGHRIDRPYVVLDNTRLRALSDDVTVYQGKVTERLESAVRLTDGRRLTAALVIDASGAPPGRNRAEQTAVGAVVTKHEGEAILMDWRGPGSTFLYAVPLGGGRMLYEETSLARRPGLPLAELRNRLHARLGIESFVHEERVRFPLDVPRPGHLAFGAAAAFVHPATGYGVATSLTLAPQVAAAIADALPGGPRAARRAAQHVVWPPSAKLVHVLRRRGLEALLRMSSDEVREFFDLFFTLPGELQRAYLSGRDDVLGTARAMAALFRAAPWTTRTKLALW